MPAILHPSTAAPAPRLFALDVPPGWRVQREARQLVTLAPEAPGAGVVPSIVVAAGHAPAGTPLESLGGSVLRRLARQGRDVEVDDGRIGTLSERRTYIRSLTFTAPGSDLRIVRLFATWMVLDDASAGDGGDGGPVDAFTVLATGAAADAGTLTVPFLRTVASVAVGPRLVPPPSGITGPASTT